MRRQLKLAALVALGLGAQVASGIGFGLISYYLKGHLPEIEGVALLALIIKVSCALFSLVLITRDLLNPPQQASPEKHGAWGVNPTLSVTALGAAAFLRSALVFVTT